LDLLALHEFIVKVTVFMRASGSRTELSPEIADLFTKYARALADQGLLVSAAKYCRCVFVFEFFEHQIGERPLIPLNCCMRRGNSEESMILRDRLYRSRASQQCLQVLGSAPQFPFTQVPVEKSQPVRGTQQTSIKRLGAAAYANNSQSNVQQAQAYQSSMQNGTISAQAPAVVSFVFIVSVLSRFVVILSMAYVHHNQAPQLPAGWMALQDPTSGRTYYANQATGETT
jgi:protein transport protein SEC31